MLGVQCFVETSLALTLRAESMRSFFPRLIEAKTMRFFILSMTWIALAIPITTSEAHDTYNPAFTPAPVGIAKATPVVVTPVDKANRIVVYTASWCGPCQRLKPVLISLKQEGYQVVYRDIDRDAERLQYAYTAVPSIFYLHDKTVIKKETGYRSKEQIKKTLVRDQRSHAEHPAVVASVVSLSR